MAQPYGDTVEIVTTPIPVQPPFIPEDTKIVAGGSPRPLLTRSRSCCYQGSSTGCASGGTLQLPAHCVEVLTRHRVMQADVHAKAGDQWQDRDLVFATGVGTELDAANVRRSFATSSRGPDSTVVVDTPRAAPQLRLSAVRRRSPARRPLSARRARQHRRFGDGLPPGATTGPHTRSRDDGHRLPERGEGWAGRPTVRPAGPRI
jgi:hypothetical protein